MKETSFWKANRFQILKKVTNHHLLQYQDFDYRDRQKRLNAILRQMQPLHNLTHALFHINFNIILLSTNITTIYRNKHCQRLESKIV
jgi:hypothetical protein